MDKIADAKYVSPPEGAGASGSLPSLCMATTSCACDFKPLPFQRRPMGERDVVIDMKFCGVCHSDLHSAASHLKKEEYPFVPGHELAGVVRAVGRGVTKCQVGQHVGVGCIIDACLKCSKCKDGEEQACTKGSTGTYGSKDKHGRAGTFPPGGQTLGGYTTLTVVDEHFVVVIPQDYPLQFAGPVMCAGITMYDPLKKRGATKGTRVGIVGLGGLGVMGVKLAVALGCEVTVISRAESKRALAQNCGASHFLIHTDSQEMLEHAKSLDLILNTVPVFHDYLKFQTLLDGKNARQVILGLHKGLIAGFLTHAVTCGMSRVMASGIGGIKNTQEVIDLCHQNNIYPEVEVFSAERLNEVFEILDKANDKGLRYVMDIAGTLNADTEEKCKDKAPPDLGPSQSGFSLCGIICHSCKVLCCCKWC